MASELRELIARVERLSGPDREVDARISVTIGNASHSDAASCQGCGCAPRYTASIDAALLLVPAHHLWEARHGLEVSATVWRLEVDYNGSVPVGWHATSPALALVLASLKARLAMEGEDD